MILKILLIVGVVAAVYFLFFKAKPDAKVTKKTTKKGAKSPEVEDMVECVVCGVYAEVHESILSNGKYYCSRECLKKGK